MNSFQAIDLWQRLPNEYKELSTFSFQKEIKHYNLLVEVGTTLN